MASDFLFAISTILWCQALPLRLLVIYAACVGLTALGKWWLG
jgi:hypothetical protein